MLENTASVQNQLWAGPVRACLAKDVRRALDAALNPLEAVEETDLRMRWVECQCGPDRPTNQQKRAALEEKP